MKMVSHLPQLFDEVFITFSEVFFKEMRRDFTKGLVLDDFLKLGFEKGNRRDIARRLVLY